MEDKYIPNQEFLDMLKRMEKEVASLPEYERRQYEAIFQSDNDTGRCGF